MISGGKVHLEVKFLALLLNPFEWVRIAGSSLMDGFEHSPPLPSLPLEGIRTPKISLLIAHFSPVQGTDHARLGGREGKFMGTQIPESRSEQACFSLTLLGSCFGANDPPIPGPKLCPELIDGKVG